MTFDEFKNQHYGGDEEKAMTQLAYESYNEDFIRSGSKAELKIILDSMDKKTANKYLGFFRKEIRDKSKIKKKEADYFAVLDRLNMSEEEIADAEKNPFLKKFWMAVFGVFASIPCGALLMIISDKVNLNHDIAKTVISYGVLFFIILCIILAVSSLINVFGFIKTKKYICEREKTKPIARDIKTEIKVQEFSEPVEDEKISGKITRAFCLKELRAHNRDRKSMYISLAVAAMLIFGLLSLGSLILAPFAIVCPILCLVMHQKYAKRLKCVENLDFHIEIKVCSGKDFKYDSEDRRIYDRKFFFTDGEKYRIVLAYKGIYFQTALEEDLYNTVNVGDSCYTLHIGDEKRISMVFPVNEYTLSEDEFTQNGKGFYPNKDMSAKKIASTETKHQRLEISDAQKKVIDDAEKAVESAFGIQKPFYILSVIFIALTVIGIYIKTLQFVNLIAFLFLLFYCSRPAIKSATKSKSAVDAVPEDYYGYYHLRDRQQKASLCIVVLLVDIITYLANIVLFILLHS